MKSVEFSGQNSTLFMFLFQFDLLAGDVKGGSLESAQLTNPCSPLPAPETNEETEEREDNCFELHYNRKLNKLTQRTQLTLWTPVPLVSIVEETRREGEREDKQS